MLLIPDVCRRKSCALIQLSSAKSEDKSRTRFASDLLREAREELSHQVIGCISILFVGKHVALGHVTLSRTNGITTLHINKMVI